MVSMARSGAQSGVAQRRLSGNRDRNHGELRPEAALALAFGTSAYWRVSGLTLAAMALAMAVTLVAFH